MGHNPVLNRINSRDRRSGQAIIMVTLSLFAMCGVLGLAVDFGWAYFVKRAAQSAADNAAIAAAQEMRVLTGSSGPYPCRPSGGVCRDDTTPFVCAPSVTNDTADNLDNACLYARRNGFEETGNQRVRISEGSDSTPPTVPGVTLQYWATVRVTESVPQLFSAITGNPIATVSARATAGLYEGEIRGSIYLINRENDVVGWGGGGGTGLNLDVQGSPNVTAGGGIFLASQAADCGNGSGDCAGRISGSSATVTAPFTSIRGTGGWNAPSGSWTAAPINGGAEGDFRDPTWGKPQPPFSDVNLDDCPIDGGVIEASTTGGTINLAPGHYYATFINGQGVQVPTGLPIKIKGNVNFTASNAGGTCRGAAPPTGTPTEFGRYVFYGGVENKNSAGDTNLSFEPGAIVFAGVKPTSNGDANPLFDMSVGGSAFSLSGSGPTSAGNIFIFTDQSFEGRLTHAPTLLAQSPAYQALRQGLSGFKSGSNQSVTFTLDGLNKDGTGFPTGWEKYNSAVMWQDRRNSSVRYTADGKYDCVVPYGSACTKNNAEMTADRVVDGSPGLFIAAGAGTVIRGNIYQPRGAWATLQGSPGMSSALQIITGALRVQGSGTVNLAPIISGLPISIVGLVE